MNTDRIDYIRAQLASEFNPDLLEVTDESHLHAGHEGAKGGGGHFNVLIVSVKFAGQRLLHRHRAVYRAVSPAMGNDIHALSIRALTPEEFSSQST